MSGVAGHQESLLPLLQPGLCPPNSDRPSCRSLKHTRTLRSSMKPSLASCSCSSHCFAWFSQFKQHTRTLRSSMKPSLASCSCSSHCFAWFSQFKQHTRTLRSSMKRSLASCSCSSRLSAASARAAAASSCCCRAATAAGLDWSGRRGKHMDGAWTGNVPTACSAAEVPTYTHYDQAFNLKRPATRRTLSAMHPACRASQTSMRTVCMLRHSRIPSRLGAGACSLQIVAQRHKRNSHQQVEWPCLL